MKANSVDYDVSSDTHAGIGGNWSDGVEMLPLEKEGCGLGKKLEPLIRSMRDSFSNPCGVQLEASLEPFFPSPLRMV